MKLKFTVIILLFLGVIMGSQAQQTTFLKGYKVLNFGVGVGTYLGGAGFKTTIPPLSLSYEVGVKDELFDANSSLGVGALLGYYGAKYEFPTAGMGGYNYHYALIGLRANAHYQFVEKLDTYLGGMLGYNLAVSSYYGNFNPKPSSPSVGGFGFAVYVGGRYYLLEKLAAFVEVGYGISPVTAGFALKL